MPNNIEYHPDKQAQKAEIYVNKTKKNKMTFS